MTRPSPWAATSLVIRVAPQRLAPALVLCASCLLAGCDTLGYYLQSGVGQLSLLSRRQPIDQLLAGSSTEPELAAQLALVASIRDFADRHLDLPDRGSYRQFVDVGRDALVWSVVTAPRYSLEAKQWCYPIVGCASYRGYFKRAAAERYARRLAREGWDVVVQRVPAYSTLGWFDDPIPSTVVFWPTAELAELIFHELAHQRVYIPDDSEFNESYATVVAAAGVRQWLRGSADHGALAAWDRHLARQRVIDGLIETARRELQALYQSVDDVLGDLQRAGEKNRVFARLKKRFDALADAAEYEAYRGWFAQDLNNAHLVSIATYQQWVPAFRQLLSDAGGSFRGFHERVAALGRLAREERGERLTRLAAAATSADHDAIRRSGTAAR